MDTPSSPRPKLHPLVATAAIALILLSIVGIGAVAMDHSNAQTSPYDAPAAVSQAPADAAKPASSPAANASVAAAAPSAPAYAPAPARSAPSTPVYETPTRVAQAPAACHNCGVVDSIREIKVKGQGTGVGAVGGAVVGGLLGNMVGSGRGKALATVAGAVGGGFGGNAIEKNVRATVEHQMVVRLDNGGTRTFTQASPFPYSQGERVRIVDGHVERA